MEIRLGWKTRLDGDHPFSMTNSSVTVESNDQALEDFIGNKGLRKGLVKNADAQSVHCNTLKNELGV